MVFRAILQYLLLRFLIGANKASLIYSGLYFSVQQNKTHYWLINLALSIT